MVLSIAESLYRNYFPSQYLLHVSLTALGLTVCWAYAQGRKTNRERDLHGRVFLITGGFTPVGLHLLQNLAERGAHLIALTPDDPEGTLISTLVEILRSSTSNQEIFAEQCDITSASSIQAFCTKFFTANKNAPVVAPQGDQRLDVVLFMHEYRHIAGRGEESERMRKEGALATFLLTTLLLPALLVAPVERDIRILNVVNPFYAAASKSPIRPSNPSSSPSPLTPAKASSSSTFLLEGTRSIQSIILTRHLQRILDALPAAQVPKTEQSATTVPVVSAKSQKSNIVAVSVSPGFSRTDTIYPILVGADGSVLWFLIYMLLQPFLRIFTRSPSSAIQSILHAIFLPTPFKIRDSSSDVSNKEESSPAAKAAVIKEEVLKPGALYSDCAVVRLDIPVMKEDEEEAGPSSSKKGKGKAKEGEEEKLVLENDGEYGGEIAGRKVWERLEEELKIWEREDKSKKGEMTDSKKDR